MPKSDHEFVNFSEKYELDYIASLYTQREKVREELEKIGKEKGSDNLTHQEVYERLDKLGYTRK